MRWRQGDAYQKRFAAQTLLCSVLGSDRVTAFSSFMAESGMNTAAYQDWQEEASGNVAADGMFSIQVNNGAAGIIDGMPFSSLLPILTCTKVQCLYNPLRY